MTGPVSSRPSKHKAVKELQGLINRIGALLAVDVDFGRATEHTVREAHEMAGLTGTGVVGRQIWGWLDARPLRSTNLCMSDVTFVVHEEAGRRDY